MKSFWDTGNIVGGGVVMVVQIFSLFIHCSGYVCFIHFLEWVLYFTNLRTKCKNL